MDDKKLTSCADCGGNDASWAIINRGVIVCEQCCIVHRTLGRHFSQIKSLTKSLWRPSQLSMVHLLGTNGINSFWEHSLHDTKSTRKKPQPNDPLHPVKSDFIRAKYQDLAFILKSKSSDNQEELNQQLHSSVRTSNLETSLRLLIQGADCNYYHPEKGNFVIHVAAHAGQLEQFELLASYGACLNVSDKNGNSADIIARLNGHHEVADRIIECTYEVTNRLIYFLCHRYPDHKNGKHFFIPEITECSPVPVFNKQARTKLQQLDNILFEELIIDVYDELDRRENEAICRKSCLNNEQSLIPFLPVNRKLSATRNQGRQKLARLSKEEFASLIWDILTDARRRELSSGNNSNPIDRLKMETQDEEPLYDSVASDDDYAYVTDQPNNLDDSTCKTDSKIMIHEQVQQIEQPIIIETNTENVECQNSVETRIAELTSQLSDLQQRVEVLNSENSELRSKVARYENGENVYPDVDGDLSPELKQRPTSLYNIAQQFIGTSYNVNRLTPPQTDEILQRTDQVTKRLQELSVIMLSTEAKHHAYVPCAEQIRIAVSDLSSIFPAGTPDEVIRNALRSLNINTIRLQAACSEMDVTIEKMRTYAFNLAKANRQILTQFQ